MLIYHINIGRYPIDNIYISIYYLLISNMLYATIPKRNCVQFYSILVMPLRIASSHNCTINSLACLVEQWKGSSERYPSMPGLLLSNHLTTISQHPAKQCRCWGDLRTLPAILQAISSSKSNMQMCSECIECNVCIVKNAFFLKIM